MLGGFIRGEIPENIIFSENGIVSNAMTGSPAFREPVSRCAYGGQPLNSNKIYALGYGFDDQLTDFMDNMGFVNISSFAGSAYGVLLVNPDGKTVKIMFTNIISVHSGDYGKELPYHNSGTAAPFIRRDPNGLPYQRYANFSQTYRISMSYEQLNNAMHNTSLPGKYDLH